MTTGPSSGGEGKAAQAAGAGPPTQVSVPRDAALAHGAFALVAAGGLAAMGWQILHRPASVGAHDWNYFFQVYEAVRLSILRYGQFPWWNIWCCGGVPLFANPQVGLFSINGVMVLLFGTVLGLKLSLVAHMLFGFEGMRRLLRRYVHGKLDELPHRGARHGAPRKRHHPGDAQKQNEPVQKSRAPDCGNGTCLLRAGR